MKNISAEEFGELVIKFFEPLAQQAGFRLERFVQKVSDILTFDVFEIAGGEFFIRIRRGIGHKKIFFVTLSQTKLDPEDIGLIRDEIGLDHFAHHDGYNLRRHGLDSLEDWQQALKSAADATRELCLPYLQGKRTDFQEIRENARRRGEDTVREIRQMRFPPNVIKKW